MHHIWPLYLTCRKQQPNEIARIEKGNQKKKITFSTSGRFEAHTLTHKSRVNWDETTNPTSAPNLLLWNVIKNTLDTCCEHSKCFTFHMGSPFFFCRFFFSLFSCVLFCSFSLLMLRNFDSSFYLWPDFSNYLFDVNIFIRQMPQLSHEISAKINFTLHLWEGKTRATHILHAF